MADRIAGNAKPKSDRRMISFFDPAAAGGGQQTESGAHDEADAHRDHADHDGSARAHQQQRRDVAAEGSVPSQCAGARRLQLGCHVHFVGRMRRPDQRQSRRQHQQQRLSTAPDREAADGARARVARSPVPCKARRARGTAPGQHGDAHMSLAFTRGSITAYSTSTTKLTITTMAASSITQLRTTIRSRLEIDWKISRPRPGR